MLSRLSLIIIIVFLLSSCVTVTKDDIPLSNPENDESVISIQTPQTQRPEYSPGELVDYIARSGDNLPALAKRFNTTLDEIYRANPGIPLDATTMPPGMPMKIPIYYRSYWGTPFLILPDGAYVNGPSAVGFNIDGFVQDSTGWLKDYSSNAQNEMLSGIEIIDLVSINYSINPRILLAFLEYHVGALSQPVPPEGRYPLGIYDYNYQGLYMQLIWVANIMNNGFYGWRTGQLTEFETKNGQIECPDPWQTSASVALHYLFSRLYDDDLYHQAIGQDGFSHTYSNLFGDPWVPQDDNIPASLTQPELTLPFLPGEVWAFTGGPHTGWGTLFPWAALDFAPGALVGGCTLTQEPTVAMAAGVVARSETGVVILDLDGDGDERTGWNLLYLHVATNERAEVGEYLRVGDSVGFPSCEGGTATGTHIHVARKYNGEWIPAGGPIPFTLDGWIAHNGDAPYEGTLTRDNLIIFACACSVNTSQIQAGK